MPEFRHVHKGWETVAEQVYLFDIWSHIHFGYVGGRVGFVDSNATAGAGLEQIGSTLYGHFANYGPWPSHSAGADNWLAGWDDPSDNTSIQIGAQLWRQYQLNVSPADLYRAVLESPR